MGFVIINGERVHTSFLSQGPSGDAPVQVTRTGDGSVVMHIAPNVAYEVFPNGDLVVAMIEGEKTVFREFGMKDLAFPSPLNEGAASQTEQAID